MAKIQEKKIQDLHFELQQWQSNIDFIQDEIQFMDKLLHSYVFEPRTPNLFERLEQFKKGLLVSKENQESLKVEIINHENEIGGIMECSSLSILDSEYCKKHEALKEKILRYFEDYHKLKSAVYAYAGSILKQRKPTS